MTPHQFTIPYLFKQRFLHLAVTAWGSPTKPPVICVHGLSRQGRDFDALAANLATDFYVLCPDLPGRGQSSWLTDPADYAPVTYVHALSHLLAYVARPVSWVGTSLGGICGMLMAAAENAPISRMVLNDIGPFIPKAAIATIRQYINTKTEFADLNELAAYLRSINASFGTLTDADWLHLARYSARPNPAGGLWLHYDPAMIVPIKSTEPTDTDLWPFWAAIKTPMLTLRGANSALLLPETLTEMAKKSATHVVPDCGHAPALMDAPTIAVIRAFLEAGLR